MSSNRPRFSICIPAYNRVSFLPELLDSIYAQNFLDYDIVICEDGSPERAEIRDVINKYSLLHPNSINYYENEVNLGYDGNIRNLLKRATGTYCFFLGNDDLILPNGLDVANKYLKINDDIKVTSRSFVRFSTDILAPIGVSSLNDCDTIFNFSSSSPKIIFRSCGFIGGLIIDSSWAKALDTNKYDGTLFYQIYLSAHAFCQNGIGYISTPIVGGRTGSPPLFGSASTEFGIHTPGSYTPIGRAKMWASVIGISRDVGFIYNSDFVGDIKYELMTRQSFHVFEMMVNSNRKTLDELRYELSAIGLFKHPLPIFLYILIRVFRSKSALFFSFIRTIFQR